ncbi:MAG: homoserine O-acetyltransferase [Gammaproteobacteria bacterium]|nr:homoserine O-acetyltransferase [Gammaproteobacteria bacterium]NND40410.1 homoserine O-acetyltransferase [Pseudomonadales bacterium]MBT8151886.1 homoserine O-acetyltransferase [Gammaproteobacteria bacterium]NNL10380.1 homoserine O-acetyltransferase [Pseudomonadales bacterium]NNM11118.1 homoserine O-acetyltransferase [Pseudomonadales bacterium]
MNDPQTSSQAAGQPGGKAHGSTAASSVGLVAPRHFRYDGAFRTSGGRELPGIELVYETYGELNAAKNNAILVCHALSGDHHAAGYHSDSDPKPGWWDEHIGPGKAIDTRHFYVVSVNNLGGCGGSTGPSSINPETGKAWGPDFPSLRVRDWVDSQHILMEHLGVAQWAAVIGGSLGGMQALRWALEYPDLLRHSVVIASALKLTAQNIGFNNTARTAIISDPDFHAGRYQEHGVWPKNGLSIARMIGHITYLSGDLMGQKFGRELQAGSFARGNEEALEFQVESYLRYQGEKFADSFDANTYLLMLRALDYFDLAREYADDAVAAFRHARCKFMIMSFSTDWRFSPARSREIVDALIAAEKPVSYAEVDSSYGHDSFLLPVQRYQKLLGAYMRQVHAECIALGGQS